jgi:ribosomal protein S18 acetylase RimI-like enzyme
MTEQAAIREFRFPADYDAALALWRSIDKGIHVGPSDTPEEIQKKAAFAPELFLVAELDGRIIGTVIGGYDGRRGMVYHLAVAEEYRHQRIGSQLMEEVERRLRARGCLKCYLLVTPDNSEAGFFYKQIGWKHVEEEHLYKKEFL